VSFIVNVGSADGVISLPMVRIYVK
jgi:hypothetical protein